MHFLHILLKGIIHTLKYFVISHFTQKRTKLLISVHFRWFIVIENIIQIQAFLVCKILVQKYGRVNFLANFKSACIYIRNSCPADDFAKSYKWLNEFKYLDILCLRQCTMQRGLTFLEWGFFTDKAGLKIFVFINAMIFAFTTFVKNTPLYGKIASKV